MSTQATIFTGVAIYLVMMLIIGIWASRRTGSTANFIVAGRRLPIWIGSATIIATWFGGGTMMGAAGASYEHGLLGVIADPFGGALCLFLVGFFFVRLFRRLRLLTFIDFFRKPLWQDCCNHCGFRNIVELAESGEPYEIGETEVTMTVFDGNVVYEK